MLGSVVYQVLSADPKYKSVIGITREELDAATADDSDTNYAVKYADWVINCIGIIKPRIAISAEEAIKVNALFPYQLAKASESSGFKVIQIATDCVYSGKQGEYYETDTHDAEDIYGKTKSLGEVEHDGFHNIRCSIIGPKVGNASLFQWFMDKEIGATLSGYTNHIWNGVTTLAFAKVCKGIIDNDLYIPSEGIHLVPADKLTKYDLLTEFADIFHRKDIKIEPKDGPTSCDRSLETSYVKENKLMWESAGYAEIPTIKEMLEEMHLAIIKGEIHG